MEKIFPLDIKKALRKIFPLDLKQIYPSVKYAIVCMTKFYIATSKCTCPIVQEQMIATTMTLIISSIYTQHASQCINYLRKQQLQQHWSNGFAKMFPS